MCMSHAIASTQAGRLVAGVGGGGEFANKVYVVSIKCNRTTLKFFVDSPLWKHG